MQFIKDYYLQSDIDQIYENLKEYKNEFQNKNILIVGGNGFLGKYFQIVLNQFGANIFVIDKYKPLFKLKNVKYYNYDITKPFTTYEKLDYILAAASIASPKLYKKMPIETMDVGFNGVKNCLELAKQHKAKLLYFSSSEVYQDATILPTPETYIGSIPSNGERSCYDISKLIGECLVYNYVKQFDIDAKIVLPFNFYGPQIPDGRVMPSFMYNIINNKDLEIYKGGEHERCYTYIIDGIIGCLLVLLKGKAGEKYNIGNPNNEISVLNLAKKMKNILNFSNEIKTIDYPEDYAGGSNPTKRIPDITKAKNILGFQPQISIEQGIERFYMWAKENYKE